MEAWAAQERNGTLTHDMKISPVDCLTRRAEESEQNMGDEGRLSTDRHVEDDLETERICGSQSNGVSPRPEPRMGADLSEALDRPLSPTGFLLPLPDSPASETGSSDNESGDSGSCRNDHVDPGIDDVRVCDGIALGRQDAKNSGSGDGSSQGTC